MSVIQKGLIGRNDFQLYDGTNTTFTRANSTGGTTTLTAIGAGTWTFDKLAVQNLSTTTATGGTASALPANPVGYVVMVIGTTTARIPFYS